MTYRIPNSSKTNFATEPKYITRRGYEITPAAMDFCWCRGLLFHDVRTYSERPMVCLPRQALSRHECNAIEFGHYEALPKPRAALHASAAIRA